MENQESLREEYNPEGSELRRLQLRMLDMLVVVDEICRRHDIPYWIEGGTLLGAVQRKADFIRAVIVGTFVYQPPDRCPFRSCQLP